LHAASSKNGGSTTTNTGRTRACVASRQTSLQPGPDRTTSRTESSYERGLIGGNVTRASTASCATNGSMACPQPVAAGLHEHPDAAQPVLVIASLTDAFFLEKI